MTPDGIAEALLHVGWPKLFFLSFSSISSSCSFSSFRNRCADAGHDVLMQEMRYAVGKYCCARLQLYHALMHYKHRLRGKLKKRIKREHSVTQVSHSTVSQRVGYSCHW